LRYLLDTSILIPFRDGDLDVQSLVEALGEFVFALVVSQVELEGGIYRDAATSSERRLGVDHLPRLKAGPTAKSLLLLAIRAEKS
jgi:tRNA(fMet)-specific endonuclease VapC